MQQEDGAHTRLSTTNEQDGRVYNTHEFRDYDCPLAALCLRRGRFVRKVVTGWTPLGEAVRVHVRGIAAFVKENREEE